MKKGKDKVIEWSKIGGTKPQMYDGKKIYAKMGTKFQSDLSWKVLRIVYIGNYRDHSFFFSNKSLWQKLKKQEKLFPFLCEAAN